MAYQIIELEPFPEQTFRVVLDLVPYSCRIYWSDFDDTMKEIVGDDKEGQWYMDIASDQITINGMALVTGCDMLGAFAYDTIGQLWLVDTDSKLSDPTFESLGSNHKLVYVPLSDLITINEIVNP